MRKGLDEVFGAISARVLEVTLERTLEDDGKTPSVASVEPC